MSDEPLVLIERYGPRGELVLNRPEKRNALIGPMVEQLTVGLAQLVADDSVRVILLRGAGGTFCSGRDRDAFAAEQPPAWRAQFGPLVTHLHGALYDCPKMTVGALERAAIAAGSALALACDLLITGDGARFHVAEVGMGMAAPLNVVWLQLKYGAGRALEVAAGGQPYLGAELVARGIALKSVKDDQVLAEARAYCDRLAGNDPAAVATVKQTIRLLAGDADFRARVQLTQGASAGARVPQR